jgi:hypothetical protein
MRSAPPSATTSRSTGIVDPAAQIVDHERMPLLVDANETFSKSYGANRSSLILIRPDGYIGYRSASFDRPRLQSSLQRIFT